MFANLCWQGLRVHGRIDRSEITEVASFHQLTVHGRIDRSEINYFELLAFVDVHGRIDRSEIYNLAN